jgi:hypothetical protein
MSRDTLIAKYETLPAVAQKQVETFIGPVSVLTFDTFQQRAEGEVERL